MSCRPRLPRNDEKLESDRARAWQAVVAAPAVNSTAREAVKRTLNNFNSLHTKLYRLYLGLVLARTERPEQRLTSVPLRLSDERDVPSIQIRVVVG